MLPTGAAQKSQEIPRFFRVVSTYNQTSDLILIRAAVFWGPRANRGPSMIHARRHESGISPSRASRSGPAVSCFLLGRLTHFLAFWPSLSFLSSVPLSAPSSASPFSRPSSCFGFSSARRRAPSKRSPRPSSSFLFVFSSLPPPSSSPLFLMVSISHLHFSSYSMLFHAWPTARNRGSYRDYVHLECTHYRPSAPRNDSPFSLCVTP